MVRARVIMHDRTLVAPLLALSIALSVACDDRRDAAPADAPAAAKAPAGPVQRTITDMAQLRMVCDGDGIANAAPYAKTAGKPSPVAYLYKDATFPADAAEFKLLTPSQLRPWSTRAVKDVQLVACVAVTQSEKVKECPFNTGAVLELYSTTTTVTIREAATGKVVEEQTLRDDASKLGCPTTALMSADRQRDYHDLPGRVTPIVAAHQPADAPPPFLPAWTFDAACSGKPALGADPRRTAAGSTNPFVVFVREGEAPFSYGDVVDYSLDQGWFDLNLKARQHSEGEPGVTLAVCMTATRSGKSKTCKYSGANLELHAATWKVELVAAATGEVVASKDFVGSNTCPAVWNFGRGGATSAEPGQPLVDWLRPFVEPK